jgi:hypothetical protein
MTPRRPSSANVSASFSTAGTTLSRRKPESLRAIGRNAPPIWAETFARRARRMRDELARPSEVRAKSP